MDRNASKQSPQRKRSPQPFAENVLPEGLTCMSCDYDLRGLNAAGNCPECGIPVAMTASPYAALIADPVWLGRMLASIRIFKNGAAIVLGVVAFSSLLRRITAVELAPMYYLRLLGIFACLALWARMVWAITAAHHALDVDRSGWVARRIVRGVLIVICLASAVIGVFFAAGAPRWWIGATALLASPIGAIGLLGAWAWSRRTQQVAELAGEKLARTQARAYLWIYASSWTAMVVFAGLGLLGATSCFTVAVAAAIVVLFFGFLLVLAPLNMKLELEPFRVGEDLLLVPNPLPKQLAGSSSRPCPRVASGTEEA